MPSVPVYSGTGCGTGCGGSCGTGDRLRGRDPPPGGTAPGDGSGGLPPGGSYGTMCREAMDDGGSF